ncbi:MAG: imidazole glycerol phosphate synthase subunit HisH, partial [Flavobacteriales bacterium]|nr:imidazole glycerol phosphate synthase subunit HisH [Flavobacteriales bacterium]
DLFRGIPNQSDVYFVHSYFVETGADTIATTFYGIKFAAAIQKNNFYAVQFHPEKSSAVGASIIKNFLAL